ncbi:hypothetical protein [Rhodococcus sp. 14-2470-1a]|uniref:hypothetical protein n=1 Tax=Rhodococcus sp. 14-2470-1a TaxID=2023150 RepID=UPI00117A90AB|nr:hypothetical protein [Rhodococcus sp. 14-2470-1a]
MTTWIEVLITMVDGPDRPVTGIAMPYRHTDEPVVWYTGTYGETPILLDLPSAGIQLTRWGHRFRIESLDGRLLLCGDGDTAWDFRDDPHRPRRTAQRRVVFAGPGHEMVFGRRAAHWVGNHWATPTGPVTDVDVAGRPSWAVTLAAGPPVGGTEQTDIRIVVDAETGTVVAEHSADGIEGAVYQEFRTLDAADAGAFRWDGPVVTDEESRRAAGRPAPGLEQERAAAWFHNNVVAEAVSLPVVIDFSVRRADLHDADSGAFTAYLTTTPASRGPSVYLSRRARSTQPWAVLVPQFQVSWCTADFDWTVVIAGGSLDEQGLRRLRRWLHPDDPVIGTPPLARRAVTT